VGAVGRPDPHSGEVPVAFVALAPGAAVTVAELEAWAAERVPERAAAPRHVEIVEEIPLTAVGKPFKPELRRRAAEQAAKDALSGTAAPDQVRAVIVDGTIEVLVPRSPDDETAGAALSAYAWTWRLV
jgi:fatty-acyl-CoA synthase